MSASEADLDLFFQAYERDFNGLCEAAMFQTFDRFGEPVTPGTFPTAKAAGDHSLPMIDFSNINDSHVGWVGFWQSPTGGAAGHTALIMPGRRWFMGSARVTQPIGGKSKNVGYIPVDQYTTAGFRGISRHSGGRTITIAYSTPMPASSAQDWEYWEPTGQLAMRVQRALAGKGRYNRADGSARPIDGKFGEWTRKGVQITLRDSGIFKGLIDGKISRGGCYGIQDYGAKYGSYKGKRDGKPREGSWTAFALGLERP